MGFEKSSFVGNGNPEPEDDFRGAFGTTALGGLC
jgi:hypothetical protein